MQLDLTMEEARFLRDNLTRRIAELDSELVRTDRYEMQHALAADVDRLKGIESRLAALIGQSTPAAS